MSFITFNTVKKAEHYVKYFNKKAAHMINTHPMYGGDYHHDYMRIENHRVVRFHGWRCGCGCDQGSSDVTVIGRIKSNV